MTEEKLRLENQLCFAMYTAAREMTKGYRPFLDEIGLTYTQYITMLVLWEIESISVKELGNRLFLDSGTLTPLLKKLESSGWIERNRDPDDERIVIITVTNEGLALKERAKEIPDKVFCKLDMPIEQAIDLKNQLNIIANRMR